LTTTPTTIAATDVATLSLSLLLLLLLAAALVGVCDPD